MKANQFWTNRETFSVWTSLETDAQTRSMVRHTIYNFGTDYIRDLCYRLWPDGRTPENKRLSKVDWKQLEEAYDKAVFNIEKKFELFP